MSLSSLLKELLRRPPVLGCDERWLTGMYPTVILMSVICSVGKVGGVEWSRV